MKQQVKSVLVLVCICAVVAVALALTNAITAPIIAENEVAKVRESLQEVYADGGNFTKVDIKDKNLPATVKEVYAASNGGYVFKLVTKGYAAGMTIMCGIDGNGVITGAKYISGGETNGAEVTMSERVPGFTLDTIDGVDTTVTPTAPLTVGGYLGAIKDALNAVKILEEVSQ